MRNFSYSITIEVYELREVDAGTELHVHVTTDEQFEEMFETSWPKALELLKGICEQP